MGAPTRSHGSGTPLWPTNLSGSNGSGSAASPPCGGAAQITLQCIVLLASPRLSVWSCLGRPSLRMEARQRKDAGETAVLAPVSFWQLNVNQRLEFRERARPNQGSNGIDLRATPYLGELNPVFVFEAPSSNPLSVACKVMRPLLYLTPTRAWFPQNFIWRFLLLGRNRCRG